MNITPLHLGSLHPIEQALTFVLAFGPFVVLGIVILVRRRHDETEEQSETHDQAEERAGGQRER